MVANKNNNNYPLTSRLKQLLIRTTAVLQNIVFKNLNRVELKVETTIFTATGQASSQIKAMPLSRHMHEYQERFYCRQDYRK